MSEPLDFTDVCRKLAARTHEIAYCSPDSTVQFISKDFAKALTFALEGAANEQLKMKMTEEAHRQFTWRLTKTPAKDSQNGFHIADDNRGNYWRIKIPSVPTDYPNNKEMEL